MEYEAVIKFGNGTEYTDKIDVPDGKDPEKYIKQIVIEFNEVEQERHKSNPNYSMDIREFVKVVQATGIIHCRLIKFNLVTIIKGHEVYDIMYCKRCKLYHKRHGLGPLTGEGMICDPSRVCTDCNRLFKTASAYKKHMDAGKHKIPEWLPDGV